jgi:UDP-3-O-[3-hydroxymyristoyl] glucosamine N-acyltransferase
MGSGILKGNNMFTVEYVKNLQWDNAEHTSFSCVVKYEEFNEEMHAGIHATDPYAHIQEIWAKGNAGEYGVIAEYVPPPTSKPIVESELPTE